MLYVVSSCVEKSIFCEIHTFMCAVTTHSLECEKYSYDLTQLCTTMTNADKVTVPSRYVLAPNNESVLLITQIVLF
jgi:hypothetical protein